MADNHVNAILNDRSGTVWIGTSNGLSQFKDGRFTVYKTEQLPSNLVTSLNEDRAGGLWVGTSALHERIFEQFYRGPNSTDKGGYGLGLFLFKHIMDAHDGTIEVKSGPGRE